MISLEFLITSFIVVHLLATVLGLAAVMHTSPLAFQILEFAGVAYLFYVAVVDPGAGEPLGQLLLLSAAFMAMTFAVFVVYGFVAHAFRRWVVESKRVQNGLRYGFAAAFAALGARLALTEK